MNKPIMQVGHATKPRFGHGEAPIWPDEYITVAIVDGDEPGVAFQKTNHIDGPWWGNEGVTLVGSPNHRSTSVGDVVVMNDGRVLRCESVGWAEIGRVKSST